VGATGSRAIDADVAYASDAGVFTLVFKDENMNAVIVQTKTLLAVRKFPAFMPISFAHQSPDWTRIGEATFVWANGSACSGHRENFDFFAVNNTWCGVSCARVTCTVLGISCAS
jgi:hypothetical protein